MLGYELFEVFELLRTEAAKVIVKYVDTRDRSAGKTREERIACEPLEVEDTFGADDRRIDEELNLRVHRVNDSLANRRVREALVQRTTEAFSLDERVERGQAADARQGRVRFPLRSARALARRTCRLSDCNFHPGALLLPTLGRRTLWVPVVYASFCSINDLNVRDGP